MIFNDGFTTKPAEPDRQRGLGLALVHRLVRNAGGTISFTSCGSAGGGTTFRVALPLNVRGDAEVSA